MILAQPTDSVDYVKCAEVLAKSIKLAMPNSKITLVSQEQSASPYFDNIVPLPHGDLAPDSDWKLVNDWQVYNASPYKYTIKLEADMIVPTDISYWWDILSTRDLVISSTIRNFKSEISESKAYRRFIVDNELPDVYNAITYFKKSPLAEEFFSTVMNIFDNWEEYKAILRCNKDEQVTTDWAYSIATHIIGIEKCMMPEFTQMSMVHMKQHINNLATSDWTNELVCEFTEDSFKVNTFHQIYPFHYHIKEFSEVLRKHYA